ncbi:hypothetical protein PM082_016504 [Marasmius tenuissimus]|nr:hypothetical protein PM082_016504 [Marasmius tenuissimus]
MQVATITRFFVCGLSGVVVVKEVWSIYMRRISKSAASAAIDLVKNLTAENYDKRNHIPKVKAKQNIAVGEEACRTHRAVSRHSTYGTHKIFPPILTQNHHHQQASRNDEQRSFSTVRIACPSLFTPEVRLHSVYLFFPAGFLISCLSPSQDVQFIATARFRESCVERERSSENLRAVSSARYYVSCAAVGKSYNDLHCADLGSQNDHFKHGSIRRNNTDDYQAHRALYLSQRQHKAER